MPQKIASFPYILVLSKVDIIFYAFVTSSVKSNAVFLSTTEQAISLMIVRHGNLLIYVWSTLIHRNSFGDNLLENEITYVS